MSKLAVFAEIFEKLVYRYIFSFVNNFIGSQQNRFYQWRSLETNLFVYMDYLHDNMDKIIQVENRQLYVFLQGFVLSILCRP